MLTLEEVKFQLQDRNISAVSRNCGVPYNTLRSIIDGRSANPEYRTFKKISDYLESTMNPPAAELE